jgi:hypothetical protein
LSELCISRRLDGENQEYSAALDTAEEGLTSNNICGAHLATDDTAFQAESASLNQVVRRVERPIAGEAFEEQFSVEDQAPVYVLPESLRLDQVRMRILKSTRAYLAQSPVLEENMD